MEDLPWTLSLCSRVTTGQGCNQGDASPACFILKYDNFALERGFFAPKIVSLWNKKAILGIWHEFCLCMGVKNRPFQIDSRAARI